VYMSKQMIKRDRTARLLKMQLLLWQHPDGMSAVEIAEKCNINVRTAYRDLHALESELDVPIWEKGSKRGIEEGYFLLPVSFTLPEAMIIFLAVRLMYNHNHLYNQNMISTFMQLNTIVPQPLRKQIINTISRIEKLPRNESKINNFMKISRAWLAQHPIKIRYQELFDKGPEQITVDPYFIESAAEGHSNYLIAYSHANRCILTFRMDCIVGDVLVDETTTFEIPADFDANDYLSSAWGSYAYEKSEPVKLRFSPKVTRAIKETAWHPSQTIEMQSDGSMIMTLKVQNTIDFRSWILGKGEDVEVLEPESLRKQIIQSTEAVRDMYSLNKQGYLF
jgi:predicted DNA-binding transcriptional regulator YafY